MSSEQLVLDAVKQKESSKKQSVLQRLFAVWFDAFVYNQIWEDPKVDLQALELDENSRILTISSGGCNTLNYLIEKPESITAVDLNRHHIYLLNLKISALKNLPSYDDFFAFFGFGKHDKNKEYYKKYIAPTLDSDTKKFWESNSLIGRITQGNRIDFFKKGGLYEHSRNGYFLRLFHLFSHLHGCHPEKIINAKTPQEQAEIYEKYIEPFFNSFFIKAIGKMPVTLFGLGIPPQQYEEIKKDFDENVNILDVYRERAKRLAVDYPIYQNYFEWQAFAIKYDTENLQAIPENLKEENYENLKSNASKIKTKIGSVTKEIADNHFDKFNRFVFLDAQDWMNTETITELWQTIAEKTKGGSRIIFRTAGASSPIENYLPKNLLERFEYKKSLSKELFKQDRASIYGGFHLYILK